MASVKISSLGHSLPVPLVQEMARGLSAVPPRYQQNDQDPPIDIYNSSFPSIPVIDMQGLISGDDLELEKLHSACKDGFLSAMACFFLQLINHGVSHELLENVKAAVEGFFKLPIEEREKIKQPIGDLQGYGQALVLSEEQKLDWSDMVFLVTHPDSERNKDIFQNLPALFREALEVYTSEVDKVGIAMLDKLAIALGIEVEEMRNFFGDIHRGMRVNYYPACPQPDLAIAGSSHSDGVGLTILVQVNETDGLQVKHQGKWVLVKPLPDAFIVNIGDMVEMFTNGIYHSCEHRVGANSEGERISVARFFSPPLETEIVPPRSLIDSQNRPLYKKIDVEKYFKGFFSSSLNGRSYIESMKI